MIINQSNVVLVAATPHPIYVSAMEKGDTKLAFWGVEQDIEGAYNPHVKGERPPHNLRTPLGRIYHCMEGLVHSKVALGPFGDSRYEQTFNMFEYHFKGTIPELLERLQDLGITLDNFVINHNDNFVQANELLLSIAQYRNIKIHDTGKERRDQFSREQHMKRVSFWIRTIIAVVIILDMVASYLIAQTGERGMLFGSLLFGVSCPILLALGWAFQKIYGKE